MRSPSGTTVFSSQMRLKDATLCEALTMALSIYVAVPCMANIQNWHKTLPQDFSGYLRPLDFTHDTNINIMVDVELHTHFDRRPHQV